MTVDEFNTLAGQIRSDTDWFPEFMKLCADYYTTNPCGGSLHTVLDDGNLTNSSIDWCAGYAWGQKDPQGNQIARLMRWMTHRQRRKVYAHYVYYASGLPVTQSNTPL